jgi:hypothetical protein
MQSQSQKQKRIDEAGRTAEHQPQPSAKRQRLSRQSRSETPTEFWDNLSRVPLCRRALRELNRRAVPPVAPTPRTERIVKSHPIIRLKRFARRGGPDLRNIRGVSSINTVEKAC